MQNDLAELFKNLSVGVYVVAVTDGSRENAFTAAWVMQISFKPPMLAISINPENYSYQLLQIGKICSVNVLGKHQYAMAEHFGRSGLTDKMSGFKWQKDITGAPILSECLVYFDCRVTDFLDAGDHKLAICEVLAASQLNSGVPLLYQQTGQLDNSEQLYNK